MTIKLYNTKTRQKEVFKPLVDGKASMYVCGPTVYERAHLGNARPVLVFDMLYRLLRHEYGAENVQYVRNFTDVDDKINARAAQTGRPISEITDETIGWFLDDMGALGALEPTDMPRATAYIAPMIAMIEDLIANGHAYAAEGHVLFKVRSYKDYGKLSGRSVDDMIAGARVEVAPYKEDPMDFVLWKPSSDDLPGWDSPWGRGRPGWHIECSAMAYKLLGAAFDIHGGGNDLTFPHHENEIAQSKCAGHDFANVWMHNEMLQVEGKKMSKSLGNFFTVRDLLEQGVPGEVIRFVMLSTHYRKPMDWTEKKREEAVSHLTRWRASLSQRTAGTIDPEIVSALSNDLNTPLALVRLHALWKSGQQSDLDSMAASLRFMGIDPALPSVDPFDEEPQVGYGLTSGDRETIEAIFTHWNGLKKEKNFEAADLIRKQATEMGLDLQKWLVSINGEDAVNPLILSTDKLRDLRESLK
ncbi:cysteinyl-tRNA synthetase [Litoreibacter meonggei]|uniref:Cysteine--tRNA ligase n=1 Tax=Litoreibacter meonggei TaxID=1049199 RepID=A0A497X2H6_9RHOB|nr:cysteine--tRNA ligase [Litoreibacter meonggei]RLJ59863.1 cysteinyl-tRNA synthetase [Litoreibacter meonggei]